MPALQVKIHIIIAGLFLSWSQFCNFFHPPMLLNCLHLFLFFLRMAINPQPKKKSDPYVHRSNTFVYLARTRTRSTTASLNTTQKPNATIWRKSYPILRIDFSSITSERNLEIWSLRPKMFPPRNVRSIRWGFLLADFRPTWPLQSCPCSSRNVPTLTSKQREVRLDLFSSEMRVMQSLVRFFSIYVKCNENPI